MNRTESTARTRRPRSVTFLAVGVLIISVLFWMRFTQAIQLRDFIQSLNPGVSVRYLAATGLVFGATGLLAAGGLWLGKAWSANLAWGFFTALAAWYWLDKIFLVSAETVQGNWPFALSLTALLLVLVRWALTSRSATEFFAKPREQFPENGDPDDE